MTRSIFTLVVFMKLILLQAAWGQGAIDKIPRNRLVSNLELFSNLDPDFPSLVNVRTALKASDTLRALESLMQHFRSRTSPKYFFDPGTVKERIEAFSQIYPRETHAILDGANGFKRTYGADVDWKRPGKDLTGREHTPNTIRFLARQWHAENIALSHFLNDQDSLNLNFLLNHIQDFAGDYEAGLAESGDNDVFERFYAGHRTRNWLSAHHLLLGSGQYRWQDQAFMVKVFLLHGARLVDQSKRFHWGNHQLHGLCALYEMTSMYPEFPVMRLWNAQALKLILEHLDKEIASDGFQFERASHYHKLDIINYFRVHRIARLNKVQLPDWYEVRFRKMFESIAALAMPTKSLPVLQDAQDSRQGRAGDVNAGTAFGLTQAYTDAAEFPEPQEALFMSLGALVFEEPQFRFFGGTSFPAAWYWFFDPEAGTRYAGLTTETPRMKSVALKETGYYVMRTGWEPNDLYMVIDGGLAQHKPDHTHGGILGLIAYAHGQVVLPNYHVRYSDPSYKILKNSYVKNVALTDSILQGRRWRDNKARTGFGIWLELPKPEVHAWEVDSVYDYFSGSHNGFDTVGVKYTRSILFVKPHYWLVLDDFISKERHTYQQIWQGAYRSEREGREAIQHMTGGSGMRILQPAADDVSAALNITAGKNAVWFVKTGTGRHTFATVLFPTGNDSQPRPLFASATPGSYSVKFGNREDRITRLSEGESGPDIRLERFIDGRLISLTTAGR